MKIDFHFKQQQSFFFSGTMARLSDKRWLDSLPMQDLRILISGDYWHTDFQPLIANLNVPLTLRTVDQLTNASFDDFSLIVIAQSRQGQFDQSTIDSIASHAPLTPIVMLLGSWCEGEGRSDTPIDGVNRIFWHQWESQFDQFIQQLAADRVTDLHLPKTSTVGDRAQATQISADPQGKISVGISAWNKDAFEHLRDAMTSFGWESRWVERSHWVSLSSTVSAVCVDANSFDKSVENRIRWIKRCVSSVPLILVSNFPRHQEVTRATKCGVDAVVAKPFKLVDLRWAITQAVEPTITPPVASSLTASLQPQPTAKQTDDPDAKPQDQTSVTPSVVKPPAFAANKTKKQKRTPD